MLKQVAVVHVSTGGYEGILAGWSCRVTRAADKLVTANLTQKFCFVAHSQPVTTVCSVGANLVSGSSDEQLKCGTLQKHHMPPPCYVHLLARLGNHSMAEPPSSQGVRHGAPSRGGHTHWP
eukprot:m.288675 g.288675  ORF g.288675 m.288675 type:complete len:121 (-) comp19452_c0_seq13:1305-1667(-)